MRTLQSFVRILGLATLSVVAAPTAYADGFFLIPGDPYEVSNADTAVAVGRGFRFEDGGITYFPPSWCQLNSVSDDGVVMAGVFCIDGHEVAFRWNWDTGDVVDLSATVGDAEAWDVSADGSVVVGTARGHNINQAFRWTAETGVVLLGDLPSGGEHSEATGVSADGLVVVGTGEVYAGSFATRAFRWSDGVMQPLGALPGDSNSEPSATSADGSVVVGVSRGRYESGDGFRWTETEGMVKLPFDPSDVSGDGRIVVGRGIWDPEFGERPLKDVLENEFDLDTSAMSSLSGASAISTDGRVIGGRGDPVSGSFYSWIAVLPHPPGQFGCNVEVSASAYTNGETVQITTLRYANLGPTPLGTRLRLQLELPFPLTIQLVEVGADGTFAIPPGMNVNLAPVTMFTVQPGQPRGNFALRCALEEVATGRVQAEDRAPFQLQ